MNIYFTNTPKSLVDKFDNNYNFEDVTPICSNTFSLTRVSEDEVKDIVKNIDPKKSTGCDGISAKLLIKATILIPFITYLINKSFIDLKVPDIWKTATVRSLYKGGLKIDLSNYRPISLLPIISKIMEKIVHTDCTHF